MRPLRLIPLMMLVTSAPVHGQVRPAQTPCKLVTPGGKAIPGLQFHFESLGSSGNGFTGASGSMRTDERGAFTTSLQAGYVYDFALYADRYKVCMKRDLEVRDGQFSESTPLVFTLDPARPGTVCGYVTLPDGKSPAAVVRVTLLAQRPQLSSKLPSPFLQNGSRFANWRFARETTTDEHGWYRIDDVDEGECAALVSASVRTRDGTTSRFPIGRSLSMSYESPPAPLRECMPLLVEDVVVGADMELRRDFRLERGGALRGIVQEKKTNKGLPGQRISVFAFEELTNFGGMGDATPLAWLVSDAQGRFEIPGLLLGPYVLKVEDSVTLETSTVVGYALASGHAKEVRLLREPPRVSSLEGRVLTASGAPVGEVHIYLPGGGFLARTVSDGTFRFPHIAFRKLENGEFVYVNVANRDGSSYTVRTKCNGSIIKLGFTLPDLKSFEVEVELPVDGVLKRDFIAPK